MGTEKAAGEVTVALDGSDLAQVEPIEPPKGQRRLDLDKGKIHMSDDFDAPLEDFEEALDSSSFP
jgi:hypothetical protein